MRIAFSRNSGFECSPHWLTGLIWQLSIGGAIACAAGQPRSSATAHPVQLFNQDSVTRDSTGRSVSALAGVVLDSSSASPLEASQILLRSSSVLKPYYTFTDNRGSFVIARVEPGRYELLIRRIGYAPHVEQRNLRAGVVDTLRVRLGISRRALCSGIDCY